MQLAPDSQTYTDNWYLITEHHDASLKIRSGIVLGCDHHNPLGLDASRKVIALDVSPEGHLHLRLVSDQFELRSEDGRSLSTAIIEPGQAIQLCYLDTKLLLATHLVYVQKLDVLRLNLAPTATKLFKFPFKNPIFRRETKPEHPASDAAAFAGISASAGKRLTHWLDQLSKVLHPGLRAPLIAITGFIVLLFVTTNLERMPPADPAPFRLTTSDTDNVASSSAKIVRSDDLSHLLLMLPGTGKADPDLVLGPIEYWNLRYPANALQIGSKGDVPVGLAAGAIDPEICIGTFESFEAFDAFDAFEVVPVESSLLSQTQQSSSLPMSPDEQEYRLSRSEGRSGVGLGTTEKSGRRPPAKADNSTGKPNSGKRDDGVSLIGESIPLNTIGGFPERLESADENAGASGILNQTPPSTSTISLPLTALSVISDKAPAYPRFRGKVDIEVEVEIRFTVDDKGRVRDLVTTGDPPKPFARAATRAVRRWRFEPYVLDGRPTPVRTSVSFTFKR
jgi:TonB family protein